MSYRILAHHRVAVIPTGQTRRRGGFQEHVPVRLKLESRKRGKWVETAWFSALSGLE